MSWLFAVSGTRTSDSYCHPTPHWTFSTGTIYLAIGGYSGTGLWEIETETSPGWAVVGIGILKMNHKCCILTRDDWRRVLSVEFPDLSCLDGHFVALRWKSDKLECFTDQLGLRTLYFSKYDKGICISTRLDWVAQTSKCSEIDFAALGSRWILFNQVSYESCVVGIDRLGPAGHATFRDGVVIHSTMYTPWLPTFTPNSTALPIECLQGFVQCALNHRYKPSLGLSGGLDSRLILALLASSPGAEFTTHTIGDLQDPDVQIAKSITSALAIPHRHFDEPLPETSQCIKGIRSYVAQTILVEPSTSWLKLRYYPRLREEGRLMIDGGFGEIARRQYLNRVVRLGRRALLLRDVSRLLQLMRTPRADIFSIEIVGLLQNGAQQSLEKALDEMPNVETIGVENFADLLAVRTRVPNYGAPEQSRIDGEILNIMPLVQPSFLRAIFGLPVKVRSNAGLYYDLIRKECPALSRFPLAKSGFRYRFGLSSNVAWLIVKLKSKFAKGYFDTKPDMLLAHLREYVLDISHSNEVMTNAMYNHRRLLDAITRYYGGELHLRNTVDWWLTFELWRRSFSSQDSHTSI